MRDPHGANPTAPSAALTPPVGGARILKRLSARWFPVRVAARTTREMFSHVVAPPQLEK